jgi:hypothetical protein
MLRDTAGYWQNNAGEMLRDTAKYCEVLRNTELLNAGELAGEMLMNTGGTKP